LDYTGDGVGDPVSDFSYNATTRVATWRVPNSLMTGDVPLRLTDDVSDVARNAIFASTIATARVRPGDVNDDGMTTFADLRANVAGQFRAIGSAGYQSRNDLDGNGVVNVVDLTLVRNHRSAESAASLVASKRVIGQTALRVRATARATDDVLSDAAWRDREIVDSLATRSRNRTR
jgi:hypothetical protein